MGRRHTVLRRTVLLLGAVVATLVALELGSVLGLWWLGVDRSDLHRERDLLAGVKAEEGGEGGAGQGRDAAGLGRGVQEGGMEVLQPYLGYVWAPDAGPPSDPTLRGLVIGRLGFPDVRGAAAPGAAPGAAAAGAASPAGAEADGTEPGGKIALLGGSLSFIAGLAGGRPLRDGLDEVLEGSPELEVWALPGYKQPQQLMTLTYMLSLGNVPDVVINVDGFNDLVLPVVENLPHGISPHYPRGWAGRVRGVQGTEEQRWVGRLTVLEFRRQRLASLLALPLVRWSATADLLWHHRDSRQGAEMAGLRRMLADRSLPDERRFLTHGPELGDGAAADPLGASVELWSRASVQMSRLCESQGIPYFHFLQPNQYLAGHKPLSEEERRLRVRPAHPYAEAASTGYPLLVAEGRDLRRQGVRFHDLTGIFADHPETVWSDDCCHLNGHGNALLVAEIVRRIAGELGPPGSGRAAAGGGEAPLGRDRPPAAEVSR